jgi:hypothetical protein
MVAELGIRTVNDRLPQTVRFRGRAGRKPHADALGRKPLRWPIPGDDGDRPWPATATENRHRLRPAAGLQTVNGFGHRRH